MKLEAALTYGYYIGVREAMLEQHRAVDENVVDTAEQLPLLIIAVDDPIPLFVSDDESMFARDTPVVEHDVVLLGTAHRAGRPLCQVRPPRASRRFCDGKCCVQAKRIVNGKP